MLKLQLSVTTVTPATELEVVEGLVVPKGTAVLAATAAAAATAAVKRPELAQWPTAEAATAAVKSLLGIRKKRPARQQDEEELPEAKGPTDDASEDTADEESEWSEGSDDEAEKASSDDE